MEFIGKGIYTYQEASAITGVKIGSVRRWFDGYKNYQSESNINPLIIKDFRNTTDQKIISFLDLVELLFINAFHSHKISLQSIRVAVDRASSILGTNHPFAMKKFYTDGKTILAEITHGNDSDLLDLNRQQYQLTEIVFPGLYNCIDFSNFDVAERYWPLGKDHGVVIDPGRNFGKPIINDVNVSVQTIYELIKSGHSDEEISDWYEIEPKYVKFAKEYEMRLTA